MPSIMYSPEVPMSEYVIGEGKAGDTGVAEVSCVMQCTSELAYAWFSGGILKDMRLSGKDACIIINKKDWETDFWKIKKPEVEE